MRGLRVKDGQVRTATSIQQSRFFPSLPFRKQPFKFEAHLPHAQSAGPEDELGQGLAGFEFI